MRLGYTFLPPEKKFIDSFVMAHEDLGLIPIFWNKQHYFVYTMDFLLGAYKENGLTT